MYIDRIVIALKRKKKTARLTKVLRCFYDSMNHCDDMEHKPIDDDY